MEWKKGNTDKHKEIFFLKKNSFKNQKLLGAMKIHRKKSEKKYNEVGFETKKCFVAFL